MAFEHYFNTASAPPSPSSPLSTKSHLRTSADLQSVGSIKLTPEELARIDASLTNFFQQHLNSGAANNNNLLNHMNSYQNNMNNNNFGKENSAVVPMEMEELPSFNNHNNDNNNNYNSNNYDNNNYNNKESFMRIGENDLERLSLKTDQEDVWGGGGGWKTSPNAYNVPQTDPFQFQQTPATPRTSSSMRVMPPTPPITQNTCMKDSQQQSTTPFPSPDMRAFDDMKRLYEERISLIEKNYVERSRQLQREWEEEKGLWETKVADLEAEITRLKTKLKQLPTTSPRSPNGQNMERLRAEHAHEIQQLLDQFEAEKQASADIFKAKVKSQVVALLPKLKEQYKQAYQDALKRQREEIKEQYQRQLDKIKREMAEERRVNERLFKERLREEKEKWQLTIKSRFDQKLQKLRQADIFF